MFGFIWRAAWSVFFAYLAVRDYDTLPAYAVVFCWAAILDMAVAGVACLFGNKLVTRIVGEND